MLLPMDKARALKRGPRPSELFVDAGAVSQRRRKRPLPTKNVERSSKDKLAAGRENASRSNLFLLVAATASQLHLHSRLTYTPQALIFTPNNPLIFYCFFNFSVLKFAKPDAKLAIAYAIENCIHQNHRNYTRNNDH